MSSKATITGKVTLPGTDIGVRGTLYAEPQATGTYVVLDDHVTMGVAKAETDADGNLQSPGLKVDILSGLLHTLRFEPYNQDIASFTLGTFNLNSGGALHTLTATTVTAVTGTLYNDVLAVATAASGSATAASASATGAASSATAAAASAAAAAAPTDAAVASLLGTTTSATRLSNTRSGTKAVGQGELGLFNILDYGGVADGVTDNQAAISAARTAAAAVGGGVVFFPYSIRGYVSSSTALVSNVYLRGDNRVLLKRVGTASALFINATGVTNCGIENMTIDPVGGAVGGITTTAALRLGTGSSSITIRNCRFTDSGPGPVLSIDVQTGTSDLTIEENSYNNTPRIIGTQTVTFTASGDLVTTPAAHGLAVGDAVTFPTVATSSPGTITATFTDTGDLVTTPTAHGLVVGSPVQVVSVATTTGLTAGTTYYAKTVPTSTTFTMAAAPGTSTIALTTDGTGVLSMVKFTDTTNLVTTPTAHGLSVGDAVSFSNVTTTLGISANTTYYVLATPSTTTFTLTATSGGLTAIDLFFDGGGTGLKVVPGVFANATYYVKTAPSSTTLTLATSPGGGTVDILTDWTGTISTGLVTFTDSGDLVTTPAAHGLSVGNIVQFRTITTTTGVTAGAYYFVKTVPSGTTLTLSTGSAGSTLALTTDGTGAGFALANPVPNAVKLGGAVASTRVRRNKCSGWQERFLYVLGTATAATTDLRVEGNEVTGMIPGGIARQPITIQGIDTALHQRPMILNNTVIGAFLSYDDTNLVGTADLISLHRSVDGVVNGNTCHGGGDVGITVAMQSKGVTVTGNNCQYDDTVGICLGSATSTDTSNGTCSGNTAINNGQSRQVVRPYRTGVNMNNASSWTITGNNLGDSQGIIPVGVGTATLTVATDLVTTPAAHGLAVGDKVVFRSITTTAGISANTVYYVKTAPSSTTLTLSTTAGGTTLDLTGSDGSATGLNRIGIRVSDGTATFTDTGDLVTTPTAHGLTGGTIVQFSTINTTTGISANTNYYVRTSGLTATTFTLSTTGATGTTLALTTNGTGVGLIKPGTQQYGIGLIDTRDVMHSGNQFVGAVIGTILRSGTNTGELNAASQPD